MKTIITISGLARAGKDTLAGVIKEELAKFNIKGFKLNYATWLKSVAKEFYGEYDENNKEEYRRRLQTLGTEMVRAKNPTFWRDTVLDTFYVLQDHFDVGIIADARFENEIKDLPVDVDYFSIYIRRNQESELSADAKKHESEQLLEHMSIGEFSFVFNNFNSLKEMREFAEYVAKYIAKTQFDIDTDVSDADCENYAEFDRWN